MSRLSRQSCGRLLVSGLATVSLGCAHGEGPYPNPSRVAQGAIVGSMAGAAIGAGIDHHDRGRGALVGAVGGLLAGALFGRHLVGHPAWQRAYHDYDPHHDEWCDGDHTWDDEEDWPEHENERDAPEGDIGFAPQDVLFDVSSADLSRGAESHLRRLADRIREDRELELLLRGHTDGSGEEDFELSELRARSVRAFLTEEGVSSRRISWVGFGDSQPVVTSATREGRQRNRRVEVVLRDRDRLS